MLAFGSTEVDAEKQIVKIVHVETGRHFYGGPQQVIWLIRGLTAQGVESTLVCPPGAAIEAVAREAGIPVECIPCAGEADFGFTWRLHKFLRRSRPDVLHCHSRRGADFPGGWAAVTAKTPAIVTRRVDSPESPTAAAIRFKPFRRIVAISDTVEAVLRNNSGVSQRKLSVIRSAVDVDSMATDVDRSILHDEFGISVHGFAIAVAGQLIKRKGHRFLLDVLPGLLSEHPGIKVVFFGAGSAEDQLRALSAKLGLSGAVRFAGFRDDLDQYLAAFDLLVHPAEKEGLGVAMLKAAAAGLPVIAFNVAGSREAVRHMKTGILVPFGDVSAMQTAIGALIEEPEIGKELGATGRQRMLDEFGVETMASAYLDIYKEVLNA